MNSFNSKNLPNKTVFVNTLAETLSELGLILLEVKPESKFAQDSGAVLTMVREYLPAVLRNLKKGVYPASFFPEDFVAAPELPLGWSLFWALLRQDAFDPTNSRPTYAKGNREAFDILEKTFTPDHPAISSEPFHFEVARRAAKVQFLLNQTGDIDENMRGGGALFVVKAGMASLARNMITGLYVRMNLCPVVSDPAYLPPAEWAKKLGELRSSVESPNAEHQSREDYDYSEGFRWAFAKVRDAFKAFTEPPDARLYQ